MKTIISLFDWSGRWSLPYAEAGYRVITTDIKDIDERHRHENRWHIAGDLTDITPAGWVRIAATPTLGDVQGVLIAMPCTHFALAGAKHFKVKDADGRTEADVVLCRHALAVKDALKPKWWALENPRSRIHKLIPELGQPRHKFHPCDYGDPYRKETWLWGNFTIPILTPVEPPPRTAKGFDPWYNKVGGKSEKTKAYRSATPLGFARAFFRSNP